MADMEVMRRGDGPVAKHGATVLVSWRKKRLSNNETVGRNKGLNDELVLNDRTKTFLSIFWS